MVNISNVSLRDNHIYENFHKLIRENGVMQRIYNVTNNIFSYFHRNQNALRAAVWSYLFIEVAGFASEMIPAGIGYDLNTCQDLVCQLWSNNTQSRNSFSPTVEFRCNSSHPDYFPFVFLDKCTNDLCEYAKNMDINFEACFYSNNTDTSEQKLDFTAELWDKLCPKQHFRHNNLVKEATYINSCIISLCNYFSNFEVKLTTDLSDLCENTNAPKLNELITKLSKIIHESQKKLEEDDSWTRANTISSIVASVATIGVSVIATVSTLVTYRLTRASISSANLHSVVTALRNIMRGILQTTRALGDSQVAAGQLVPADIVLNNFISEVETLISEVSEVLEHSFSYHENTIIRGNDAGLGGAQSVVAGGAGVGSGIVIGEGGIRNFLTKGVQRIGVISELSRFEEEIDSIDMQNVTIPSSQNRTGIGDPQNFIQQFIDDLIFYSFEGYDITAIQANRLRTSLQSWQNAFCFYLNQLFCRFPLARHDNETNILIPDHHFDFLVSKKIRGLCYLLLDDLWCNWTTFLQTLSATNNTAFNHTYCPWDHVTLKVQQDTDYRIEASGNCYNQTIMVKV